jgi:hypothetical protein
VTATNRFHLTSSRLYSAGECPVCPGSGALLYLKAVRVDAFFFFCPLCGCAWARPPAAVDEINPLRDFAPDGISLPLDTDAASSGYNLREVPLADWAVMLADEAERA